AEQGGPFIASNHLARGEARSTRGVDAHFHIHPAAAHDERQIDVEPVLWRRTLHHRQVGFLDLATGEGGLQEPDVEGPASTGKESAGFPAQPLSRVRLCSARIAVPLL